MVEITVQNFRVRALGKIAIRCADMDTIVACYRDIIGLELLTGGHRADITFFKIAKGFGGHTSVLVLFRHDGGTRGTPSALKSIAGYRREFVSAPYHLEPAI